MRISLVGTKLGMSSVFVDDAFVPVTLVEVFDTQLSYVKTKSKDGYDALKLLSGKPIKNKKTAKPQLKELEKISLNPREHTFEVRYPDNFLSNTVAKIGDVIFDIETVKKILINNSVDVSGKTVGKGFAGVMKRYLFAGLEASHGVSATHRSGGSTGNRQDPGKVFKNKKMPGHMGQVQITIKNLKVVDVTTINGKTVLLLQGSVPGKVGTHLQITDPINLRSSVDLKNLNGISIVTA